MYILTDLSLPTWNICTLGSESETGKKGYRMQLQRFEVKRGSTRKQLLFKTILPWALPKRTSQWCFILWWLDSTAVFLIFIGQKLFTGRGRPLLFFFFRKDIILINKPLISSLTNIEHAVIQVYLPFITFWPKPFWVTHLPRLIKISSSTVIYKS